MSDGGGGCGSAQSLMAEIHRPFQKLEAEEGQEPIPMFRGRCSDVEMLHKESESMKGSPIHGQSRNPE